MKVKKRIRFALVAVAVFLELALLMAACGGADAELVMDAERAGHAYWRSTSDAEYLFCVGGGVDWHRVKRDGRGNFTARAESPSYPLERAQAMDCEAHVDYESVKAATKAYAEEKAQADADAAAAQPDMEEALALLERYRTSWRRMQEIGGDLHMGWKTDDERHDPIGACAALAMRVHEDWSENEMATIFHGCGNAVKMWDEMKTILTAQPQLE